MKTMCIIGIILICLIIPLRFVDGADLVKQGEGNYKAGMSWTAKAIPMEKERVEMQFDVTGVVLEAPENSPLYNATFWALSELHAVKGDYEERGFVRYTRPDGDLVFMTYEAKGKLGGERKIDAYFVGGTGRCAGMSGKGEFTGVGGLKPPKEGSGMSATVGKFTWKIP